jgi:hypothetical protein
VDRSLQQSYILTECHDLEQTLPIELSDKEIQQLIAEKKPLPDDYRKILKNMRTKRGHKESTLHVVGPSGNEFRIIVRQSSINPMAFSVILGYQLPQKNVLFRLRRYNGKHWHTNKIENDRFRNFHVHLATERYQELGADEETYAGISSRFHSVESALECLFADCGFEKPLSERQQATMEL